MVAWVACGGGTVAVLLSQGGVGDAESAKAPHRELKRVVQKDRKINFGQTGGFR